MVTAWLRVIGTHTETAVADVVRSLSTAGVSLRTNDRESTTGLSLILFDEIREDICSQITNLTKDSRYQVLAVAVSPVALAVDRSWRLLEAGAGDAVLWDGSVETAGDVAARLHRWDALNRLVASSAVRNTVVGTSPSWISALREVVEAARYTDDSILIAGDTGTGKELVARLVQRLDPRRSNRDLTVTDCAAIVPSLSGSEFFGHERGAFTGASATRDGAFAVADGGVLFLDEVGELPLDLQAQLLRVIQEKRFKRVGGNTWQSTDFRLVSATNRDLWKEVEEGHFRRDLYYRLASWTVNLPPLSQRVPDIIPLAECFLTEDGHGTPPVLTPPVREYFLRRSYPGNIRDLRQLCLRMRGRHVGSARYTVGDIPPEERKIRASADNDWRRGGFEVGIRRAIELGVGLKEINSAASDAAIDIATQGGSVALAQAAQKLKITPRALQLRRQKQSA